MNKKKTSGVSAVFGIMGCVLIGMVAGVFMATRGEELYLRLFSEQTEGTELLEPVFIFLYMLMFAVVYLLHIFIHEAGHLVGGLLTGYKFLSYRIFSIVIQKTDGRLEIKRFKLAGTAGQCLMICPKPVDGKVPYVLYNLGGGLMNIVVSAICALLMIPFGNVMFLSDILFAFALVGVLAALINLVPYLVPMDNDGKNLLNISRSYDAKRAFYLIYEINALQTEGKRLKDIPDELFFISDNPDIHNTMVTTVLLMKISREIDRHNFESAYKAVKSILNSDAEIPSVNRYLLRVEQVYLAIINGESKDDIENMMDKELLSFMNSMKKYPSVIRTQYAYYKLIDNNNEEAEKQLELFESITDKHPIKSDVDSERELIKIADTMAVTA